MVTAFAVFASVFGVPFVLLVILSWVEAYREIRAKDAYIAHLEREIADLKADRHAAAYALAGSLACREPSRN